MTVQPIRLFGDPVLRTPRRRGRRLRQGAAPPWSRTSGTPWRTQGGAGLAAPQLGVGLRVFTYHCDGFAGHLVNPTWTAVDEEIQDGEEGCLSIPGLYWDCRARQERGGRGLEHARRAGGGRGHRPAGPLHPARDRPPRRRAVPRPARRGDPQGGDEGDPRGRVVRRRRADDQAEPALAVRRCLRRCGWYSPARPRSRCRRCARSSASDRHEVVAVVTRPDAPAGRGRHLVRSPVGALADEHGIEVLTPAKAVRPRVPRPAAGAGARLLPGRRVRGAAAAVRARHPAARLGEPALLGAARRGGARRRCRPRSGTATRSPARARSGS